MLRYFTAGETHGKCLTVIVEGMPSNVQIDEDKINEALAKRQKGYGRGGRMSIEKDRAEILSGVRGGYTLGSPIALKIENRDWVNWENIMGTKTASAEKAVSFPRPGHAARVAAGELAAQLLEPFGIEFKSRVACIGEIEDNFTDADDDFYRRAAESPVGFGDTAAAKRAMEYIDKIKADGASVGGVVETAVIGLPPGLGSYVHYDRKLDANIAFGVMSIQAIKGVEFGMGFNAGRVIGADALDEIEYNGVFSRSTNRAGGIEGGMSNGEPIIVRAAMKPIPTQYKPLKTVNLSDKTVHRASVERSDVCAVPACSVVVESAVKFEIAKAFLEKFSGDCMEDVKAYYDIYMQRISKY